MSGISGAYIIRNQDTHHNLADLLYPSLKGLQHRGEYGVGIAVDRPQKETPVMKFKEEGWVDDIFLGAVYQNIQNVKPLIGIGITNYPTRNIHKEDLQPVITRKGNKTITLGYDGTILAMDSIREGLELKGYKFRTQCESEILGYLLLDKVEEKRSINDAVREMMEELYGRGGYSIVCMYNDGKETSLIGIRDPTGLKPCCIGEKDGSYLIASETCALDMIDARLIGDLKPGGIFLVNKEGGEGKLLLEKPHKHDVFEWIYSGAEPSYIEGVSVAGTRLNLGHMAAERYSPQCGIVVPIPDSGKTFAMGISEKAQLPYKEALFRNRGTRRTYQMPDEYTRKLVTGTKFIGIGLYIKDKYVLLPDDSIVRGTITRSGAMEATRRCGPKNIDIYSSFAPIFVPLINSVDKPSTMAAQGLQGLSIEEINEEVAKRMKVEDIKYNGAVVGGGVFYNTPEDVVKAVGLDRSELYLAGADMLLPIKEEFLPKQYLNLGVKCTIPG